MDESETKKASPGDDLGVVVDAVSLGPVVLDVYGRGGRPAGRHEHQERDDNDDDKEQQPPPRHQRPAIYIYMQLRPLQPTQLLPLHETAIARAKPLLSVLHH